MLRLALLLLYLIAAYSFEPSLLKLDQNAGLDPDGRAVPTSPTSDHGGGLDPNGQATPTSDTGHGLDPNG